MFKLLGRLIDVMEGHVRGAGTADAPERWEDDAYIYLESTIGGMPERDVDISVHDGRILIRLER